MARALLSGLLALSLLLAGCGAQADGTDTPAPPSGAEVPAGPAAEEQAAAEDGTEQPPGAAQNGIEEEDGMKLYLTVGERTFSVTPADTTAAEELAGLLEDGPLALTLSDYAGFEKVGPLGTTLTASDWRTTTRAGDIVLYQGDQIVLFYGSNTWSYTRLGRVDDLTGWADALGGGDVEVTLSLEVS